MLKWELYDQLKINSFLLLILQENEKEVDVLKATVTDPLYAAELNSFIELCENKKDLQLLFRGLREYSLIVKERKALADVIRTDFSGCMAVHLGAEYGDMIEAFNTHHKRYFYATWKIQYEKVHHRLISVFGFRFTKYGKYVNGGWCIFNFKFL